MYRIVIDRSLCSGFGACVDLAPHAIEIDDEGIARVLAGETDGEAARAVAAACPMGAISVHELESV